MEEPSIVPFKKKKKKRAINSFRHARQTCDFSRWGKNLLHLIIQFPPIFSHVTIDIYLIFKYHMSYKNRKKQILSYRCDVNMDERAKI